MKNFAPSKASQGCCDQTGSSGMRFTMCHQKDAWHPARRWCLTITLRAYLALLDGHRSRKYPDTALVTVARYGRFRQEQQSGTSPVQWGGENTRPRARWGCQIKYRMCDHWDAQLLKCIIHCVCLKFKFNWASSIFICYIRQPQAESTGGISTGADAAPRKDVF